MYEAKVLICICKFRIHDEEKRSAGPRGRERRGKSEKQASVRTGKSTETLVVPAVVSFKTALLEAWSSATRVFET